MTCNLPTIPKFLGIQKSVKMTNIVYKVMYKDIQAAAQSGGYFQQIQ